MEEMLAAFVKELELREIHNSSSSDFRKPASSTTTAHAFFTSENEIKEIKCAFCLKPHAHEDCRKVQDIETRKLLARKYARCFVCLKKNHLARDCKSNLGCKGCGGKHHLALCSSQGVRAPNESANPTVSSSGMHHIRSGGKVALQTAQGIAKGEREATVRVLFDSGSHRSFITSNAAESINPKIVRKEWLQVSTFGEKSQKAELRDVAALQVKSVQGEKVANIEVYIVPQISTIQNSHVELARKQYPHLKGVWFSDVSRYEEELEIDILVGADYLWNFQMSETRRGRPEEPVAVETGLGWVLSGPLAVRDDSLGDQCSRVQVHFVGQESIKTENKLVDDVHKLWDLETLGIRECNEIHEGFLDNVSFTGERYSVKLPWKEGHEEIPSNYSNSLSRLKSQVRRLEKEPEVLAEYDTIMKQQIENGIVERVTGLEKANRVHYLPHQGVIRKDAITTKLRIVFDASCKGDNGVSLNDCLHVGPPLSPMLYDILLRFRVFRVALVADIEKAFLNVEIDQEDRDCLRFLWMDNVLDNDQSVSVYRFARVVFGLNSSPFLLNATLQYHFSTFEKEDPCFVRKMIESFYVDDLVSGEANKDAAISLYEKAKNRLAMGGFKLRKWITNDKGLEEHIQSHEEEIVHHRVVARLEEEESYASTSINSSGGSKGQKVLGQSWDSLLDILRFELASIGNKAQNLKCTKRNMLSILAGVFDPLGIISPGVISAKICFQQVCGENIKKWDEELSGEVKQKWEEWCRDLQSVGEISVDRCLYEYSDDEVVECFLHGFGDASMKAYCAVIYFVYRTRGGTHVKLLTSKTRVAPLKALSIPRLELMSARILAQLMNVVKHALSSQVQLTGNRMWLDSVTALYWIRNRGSWKQFVQHRVNEILKLTSKCDWGHCPGVENPADLGSRGMLCSQLKVSKLWWEGPTWLSSPQEEWPSFDMNSRVPEALEEEKKSTVLSLNIGKVTNVSFVVDVNRHSTLNKLFRVTALVRRFLNNLRVPVEERIFGKLEIEELQVAEEEWIKCAQLHLKDQSNFKQVEISLGLVSENGVLRCKGRLGNSDIEYNGKYPIILPKEHRLTKLVIEDCHQRVGHSGVRATLAELRSRYWVTRGRQVVKKIVSKCIICKRFEGRSYSAATVADLPEFRVREAPPFSNCGVDFAGPLFVKGGVRSSEKVHIALFTCCVTRAVHLDLVEDLSASTFIRCLRKFTARRGTPALIVSDNAKTFKATDKILQDLYNHPEVRAHLEDKRIKWRFNLERTPWWGGFFERMVGSVKQILRKVLGNARLTHDELLTVLVEAEGTLNSRPLTFDYEETEGQVLTPSHLIYGRRLNTIPDMVVEEDEYNNVSKASQRFRYLSIKLAHFWLKWRKEYLVGLREFHRCKLSGKERIVKAGDVVIVDEEGKKRSKWKVAVVESLIRGQDQEARGARVRLIVKGKPKVLNRPIQKLYPLEIQVEVESKTADKGVGGKTAEPSENRSRPRRAAAAVALKF